MKDKAYERAIGGKGREIKQEMRVRSAGRVGGGGGGEDGGTALDCPDPDLL